MDDKFLQLSIMFGAVILSVMYSALIYNIPSLQRKAYKERMGRFKSKQKALIYNCVLPPSGMISIFAIVLSGIPFKLATITIYIIILVLLANKIDNYFMNTPKPDDIPETMDNKK